METADETLDLLLLEQSFEELVTAYNQRPSILRKLVARLYHADERLRMNAARAIGHISVGMEREKLLDLLRRLQWMMSDESGSNCWNAPHAMGEIGFHRPDVIDGFLGNLRHFAKDPDRQLSTGAQTALERIEEGKRRAEHKSGRRG